MMNNNLLDQTETFNAVSRRDYIVYKFDALLPGKGFIINEVNDPHQLYFKLREEKGDTFSWEYLEVGPKEWCIRICKRDSVIQAESLGNLAVSDHRKALILRKHGLDFSFNGRQTLREACNEKEISARNIERELSSVNRHPLMYAINYSSWDLDYLADFIERNHHAYTVKVLNCISNECAKNAESIEQRYSGLQPVIEVFKQLHADMKAIMIEEEQILFPYIRFLAQIIKGKIGTSGLPAGSFQDRLNKIELAQTKIAEQINFIRKSTGNYTLPDIKSSCHDTLLTWLNEIDNDLHQHIHIENNILFPKTLKLEKHYLANITCYYSTGTPCASSDNFSLLL